MEAYQREVYDKFEKYRLERDDPNYPPHHEGMHLEEYFCLNFKDESRDRIFIPVHWTAVYNYKVSDLGLESGSPNFLLRQELQASLNTLDDDREYFIVATHDDAPKESLPKNTKVFAAGGNSAQIDDPIPLICGPHKNIKDHQKEIYCSFVGSMTHPIRHASLSPLVEKPGYVIQAFHWNATVPINQVDLFKTPQKDQYFVCVHEGMVPLAIVYMKQCN